MKSRINRISYEQLKNLGDYESCRVVAEANVAEGDKPSEVMRRLKRWVATQLDEGPYEDDDEEVDSLGPIVCKACNDTGYNSKGGLCAPCQNKGRV